MSLHTTNLQKKISNTFFPFSLSNKISTSFNFPKWLPFCTGLMLSHNSSSGSIVVVKFKSSVGTNSYQVVLASDVMGFISPGVVFRNWS